MIIIWPLLTDRKYNIYQNLTLSHFSPQNVVAMFTICFDFKKHFSSFEKLTVKWKESLNDGHRTVGGIEEKRQKFESLLQSDQSQQMFGEKDQD